MTRSRRIDRELTDDRCVECGRVDPSDIIGQLRLTGLHVTCVLIGTISVVLTESVCLREKRTDSCVVDVTVNLHANSM